MSDTLGNPNPLAGLTAGGLSSVVAQNINLAGVSGNGNRTYYGGLPLMVRFSNYATVHNKAGRSIQAMPRQKFLFYATFNAGVSVPSHPNFGDWRTGFAFQIQKTDRPKASPQVKSLHQYNRQRLVQTGIKYDPLTITFHDTVDDRILRVWRDYYTWYFGDGRTRSNETKSWGSSVLDTPITLDKGWGFSPPMTTNRTNFFDSLDIYTFYGKKYTQVRMYNPKITSMTFDEMDTESSALSTAGMTVEHEGFAYVAVAQPLGSREINLFNLTAGDYYEPTDLFGGLNSFLMDINDSLTGAVDSLLNNVAGNIPFVGQALAGVGSSLIRSSGVTSIIPSTTSRLAGSSLNVWGKYF
jgi:hypothetical protein